MVNELEDGSPPSLEFVSLSDRRGSLRSLHDASRPSERRRSSAWDGLDVEANGRRPSFLLSKRSGELGWAKGPPSPANRRTSLAASIHQSTSSSNSSTPPHGRKGRRPSSSSSAISSATIRPPSDGSPTNPSSLLPFGHHNQLKNTTRRRSSLNPIPLASLPITTTTPINVSSSTSTSFSSPSFHSHLHHPNNHPPSTRPSPSSSTSLRNNFLLPLDSPAAELKAYRFGSPSSPSSSGQQTHVAPNGLVRSNDGIAPDAIVEDEVEADRARQRFREQLMQAGISSIQILLPPPAIGSNLSPLNSPHSTRRRNRPPPLSSPGVPTPGTRPRRRPSEQFYNASPTNSIRNERLGPWRDDDGDLRSSDDEGSDYFADQRNSFADHADDEGSGVEDETDSEDSEERRLSVERKGERAAEAEAASVAAMVWRTPEFRNPFDASNPHPSSDPQTPSALSYMNSNPPSQSQNALSLNVPPMPTNTSSLSSSSNTPTSVSTGVNNFLFQTSTFSPPPSPSQRRRPSLATSQKSFTRMFPLTTLPQTHPCPDSPARSVSDSAVPRRPSLAAEVGLTEPTVSGPSSVAGHEEVEWDLNFVLGRSGSESGYSAFVGGEDPTGGQGGEFGTSASLGGIPELGRALNDQYIDTFAQFVQENDPQFDKVRLAWTLNRSGPSSNVWSLPSSGGYTYYPPNTSLAYTYDNPTCPHDTLPQSRPNGSSSDNFPPPNPYGIVRTNTEPSSSWTLKPRGKGWGIGPLDGEDGAKDEIRFGPKGKWRSRNGREGSGSSATSARRRSSRESSKDGESMLRGKRQAGRRLSSKERIMMANAAFQGSRPIDETLERGLSLSPEQMSNGSPPISPKTGAKSILSRAGSGPDHLIARTNSPSQLSQSISGPSKTSPSSDYPPAETASCPSKPAKKDKKEKEKEEKEGLGAKLKKKGGWFSTLKHATTLASHKDARAPHSTSVSSSSSILSGSISGNEDDSHPPRRSLERPTAAYVPPWMTSTNPKDVKASPSTGLGGLAGKIKLKRRSLSDGTKKTTKGVGSLGNASGGEEAAFSFGSKRKSGFGGTPVESDIETDDGEDREGIAWEDVPIEALAMVIPLRLRGSASEALTSPRQHGSSSTTASRMSGLLVSDSRRSSDFAFLDGQWSPRGGPNGSAQLVTQFPPPSITAPAENSLLVYFVPFGHPSDPSPGGDAGRGHSSSHVSTTPTTNPLRFIKPGSKLHKTSSQIFHRSSKESSSATTSSNTRLNASSSPSNLPTRPTVAGSRAIPISPSKATNRPPINPSHQSSNFSNQSSLFSASSGLSTSPSKPLHLSSFARASFTRNSTSISATSSPRARFAPFPSSSPFPSHNPSFSSFRIVARIVDPSDLTFLPSWPSWESQPFATTVPQGLGQTVDISLSGPGTNPETKAKETRDSRTDPTVVGVCHGAKTGVEFVREGWERLGFLQSRSEEDDGKPVAADEAEDGLKVNGLDDVLGVVVTAVIAILT